VDHAFRSGRQSTNGEIDLLSPKLEAGGAPHRSRSSFGMKGWFARIALLVAATLSAQPAVAQRGRAVNVFCNDIRTLARAADEAVPFASLSSRDYRPRLGRAPCFFSAAGGYTCSHNLARPDETAESYAVRIRACLPGAVWASEGNDYRAREIVRRGRFRVEIEEHGTARSHVGRRIAIYISSARPAGNR
jgi:hypothetical protein